MAHFRRPIFPLFRPRRGTRSFQRTKMETRAGVQRTRISDERNNEWRNARQACDYRSTLTTTRISRYMRQGEKQPSPSFSSPLPPPCPRSPEPSARAATLICSESPAANNGGITGCLLWIEIPVNFLFASTPRERVARNSFQDVWGIPSGAFRWLRVLRILCLASVVFGCCFGVFET